MMLSPEEKKHYDLLLREDFYIPRTKEEIGVFERLGHMKLAERIRVALMSTGYSLEMEVLENPKIHHDTTVVGYRLPEVVRRLLGTGT